MFSYQQTNRYFAQITGGMEDLGAEELAELGAQNISPAYRGIYFDAGKETLYRINYTARLLTRVLAPLTGFGCHTADVLYNKAKSIEWKALLDTQQTFAIFANVSHSKITHSRYAALRLKDAIADYFQENFRKRPSVDTQNPDVWLNLHIENNRATISLDVSGGSLHKRGYRKQSVEAPMQETLAAAIIRLSEWDGLKPIYDPFCGSGTLLSEALMQHCRIPAGYLRSRFGFESLPDFDKQIWQSAKKSLDGKIRHLPKSPNAGETILIAGSDVAYKAIAAAKKNLRMLPSGENIKLKVTDFREISRLENTVIICNPPYGIRMGQKAEIAKLYKTFGDFLKQKCQGSEAYVYFGDRKLIPHIGLRPAWKNPLVNGALDGRLCKFEIY